MDKTAQKGVPKIILIMIPVLLVAMYCYAAFVDTSAPENAVKEFYTAYFDSDSQTVAEHLSVFWAQQMMPQYVALTPKQLLAQRATIESNIAKLIGNLENSSKPPSNIEVEIKKGYTRMGKNSAVVAYSFMQGGKEQGMEAAFLIKEEGQFRIYNLVPLNSQTLEQVKKLDIKTLDQQITNLLKESK